MRAPLLIAIGVWLSLIAAPFCHAQRSRPKANRTPEIVEAKVKEEDALFRAKRIAVEVSTLEPLEERVRLLTAIADALWERDETFARQTLRQAFDAISDQQRIEDSKRATPLLRQIISIAAKHDPKLAREFLDGWSGKSGDDSKARLNQQGSSERSELLLISALQAFQKDKLAGASLFRESVRQYVLPRHYYFLAELREKSPDEADHLFTDAIEVLSLRPLHEANEAMILASYLFSPQPRIVYTLVGQYNAANVNGNLSAPPKNESLARRFLFFAFNKLTTSQDIPAPVIYFALKNLLPQFQALTPDLATEVQARLSSLLPDVPRAEAELQDRLRRESERQSLEGEELWEERAQRADKIADARRRDLEYFTIIQAHLLAKKDFVAARRLADKISDPTLRRRVTDYLNFWEIREKLKRNDELILEDDAIDKIEEPILKTILFCELAKVASRRNDLARASETLDRAISESSRVQDAQDRVQSKIIIAQTWMLLDANRGFEEAKTAIQEINKMEEFKIDRSAITFKISVHDLMNELYVSDDSASLFSLLDRMSEADYFRTLELCGSLQNKLLRSWATWAAIRRYLVEINK